MNHATRAHHVLEDILKNRMICDAQIGERTSWQDSRKHFADLIFAAQKFYIGNLDDLPAIANFCPELIRLPNPISYFDLEVETEEKVMLHFGVLLIEKLPWEAVRNNKFFSSIYDRLLLMSYTFTKRASDPSWMFAPWTSAVTISECGTDIEIVTEADSLEVQPMVKNLAGNIADYHVGIVSFLHLIHCPNVAVEKIPEPTKLNKKRERNLRPPIQSYSVVKLPNYSPSQPSQGGTHASPRAHFRRGHIRRLSESKVTWVRHTMVKGEGFVPKHYVRGQ